MAYGLKVYDASSNIRLDTTDREFRYVAFYTGSVAASASTTVSVSGLTNDGTWGLNETQGSNLYLDLSIGTNQFTVTNTNGFNSGTYNVQVFRI
jgi:hypothetical protein